ncbi:MAG: hypothetical protein ABIZ70_11445 [Gemmatimonadales bacterium]
MTFRAGASVAIQRIGDIVTGGSQPTSAEVVGVVFAVVALIGLVVLVNVWRVRRLRRPRAIRIELPAVKIKPTEQLVMATSRKPLRTNADRVREAERLAADGASIAAIAREIRLCQDAVRSLVGTH